MSMTYRRWMSACAVTAMVVGAGVLPYTVSGQTPAAAKTGPTDTPAGKAWTPPRTSWGDPDLQGIWTTAHFGRSVPLERSREYAGRVELTQEEADARFNRVLEYTAYEQGGGVGTHGREWFETEYLAEMGIKQSRRTSQIIDPPDGRIPFTAEALKRRAERAAAANVPKPVRGVEDLATGRCLGGAAFPGGPGVNTNNGKRIVQAPDYVVILYENANDARVIPVAGQPTATMRRPTGQARGRWEGNTLVIENTRYSGEATYQGAGEHLRIVERFTRTSAGEIDYQFTVEDPTTFTRPWTVGISWLLDPRQTDLMESACHEGNYSLPRILRFAQMETERTGVYNPLESDRAAEARLQVTPPAGDAATKKESR